MKLIVAAILSCLAAVASAAEPTSVRLMTWNVEILIAPRQNPGQLQKYRFDFARNGHLDRTADIIEVLNPDILNLVEATSVEVIDALIARLHAKGLTDYRGYHIESHDGFTGMDVGLITKLEPDVIEGQPIRTYWSAADDPTYRQAYQVRSYSGATVNKSVSLARNSGYFMTIAGHKLGFLGLHFKSNPSSEWANAQRVAESKIAQRVIMDQIVRRGYTPIVLGDLNDYDPDVPDRDETRDTKTDVIRRLKNYNRRQRGNELFNAAKLIVNQEDRYSSHWDWNENDAFDSQDVLTMIDHILLPTEFEPYVRRAFIAHCVGLETSDHFPVVVDLEFPQK